MKANWDAALDNLNGRTGSGVVVHDSNGTMTAAQCSYRQGLLALLTSEVSTALMAVKLCRALGDTQVHLEGDAKVVVDAINSLGLDQSRLGHVVEDVRVDVYALSPRQFTFVKRDGNHATHTLSKFAVQYALDQTWRGETLNCIKDTIFLEQTALGI